MKTIIGTSEYDKDIKLRQLETETETPEEMRAEIKAYEEEHGVMPIPTLKPDKFAWTDIRVSGKMHPEADEIMLWVREQEKLGKDIPDTVEDLIKAYEAGK